MRAISSVVLLSLVVGSAARADDPIDSVLERSPEIATPKVVRTFSERLIPLWLQALDRPEVDHRCQAAGAIGRARELGMTGLEATIPALTRELGRDGQHSSVALAAARALVALDAKVAAPALFKLSASGDIDLRESIEPALARWSYGPARDAWLKRLNESAPLGRGMTLTIQSLAAAGETRAAPRLRELVLSAEASPTVRLEAARALGQLKTSGSEADAEWLGADASPKGFTARLCGAWLLRRHSGDAAIRLLQAFVRDTEPSVAAVAVARLAEIDPVHVEPVLAAVLASSDANVRGHGVGVLFRRPSDKHLALLGARLSDVHPDVRSQASVALRELAPKFRAGVLVEGDRALAGTDWRGREQAAILFAQLDHKAASGRLVDALADARPEAAVAAAWALRVLAVPETLPEALDHFKQNTKKPEPPEWRDRQLGHLAQFFGQARYAPADAALRAMIPLNAPGGLQTRASACWALGLLHEGKPLPALASLLAGRLAAVNPFDFEAPLLRSMCAATLGRIKANDQLPTLRRFYAEGKPTFEPVNNVCGWAIEQLTGEKMPAPGIVLSVQRAWFLTPFE